MIHTEIIRQILDEKIEIEHKSISEYLNIADNVERYGHMQVANQLRELAIEKNQCKEMLIRMIAKL